MHLACARVIEMPATGGLWALPSRSVAILRPRPRASGSVCPGAVFDWGHERSH